MFAVLVFEKGCKSGKYILNVKAAEITSAGNITITKADGTVKELTGVKHFFVNYIDEGKTLNVEMGFSGVTEQV